MASLQTNAILPAGPAPAPKASAPVQNNAQNHIPNDAIGNSTFATMLPHAEPKPVAKTETKPKSDGTDKKPAAAEMKNKAEARPDHSRIAKADSKSDRKAADARDGKKDEKQDDKRDDARADDQAAAADAKPQSHPAPQDIADDLGDDIPDGDARTPVKDSDADDPASAVAMATTQLPPPAQPLPQAQPASPDAALQAQQMLQAPAIPPSAANDTGADNDNDTAIAGVGVSGAASSSRPTSSPDPSARLTSSGAPDSRAPSSHAPSSRASDAATQAGAGPGQADPVSAKTQTPAAAAPLEMLKSAGHESGKSQTAAADSLETAAPQPADPAPAAPQATQPAPSNPASNFGLAAAIPAPAAHAIPTAATNTNIAANIHVAAQTQSGAQTANVNSLAVEIAAKSQSGAKEFHIRLDPPELGHVDVRLSIDASGKAEAHMTTDQPQTLHLLQKDSDTLTRALRDAGLDVSQGSLNFSLKGQDRQSSDGNNNGAQTRTPALSLAVTRTIDAAQSANPYLSSAGDARLDIHV